VLVAVVRQNRSELDRGSSGKVVVVTARTVEIVEVYVCACMCAGKKGKKEGDGEANTDVRTANHGSAGVDNSGIA